jgi:hypothetical protein
MNFNNPVCLICGKEVPVEIGIDRGHEYEIRKNTHDGDCFEAFINMQVMEIKKEQKQNELLGETL